MFSEPSFPEPSQKGACIQPGPSRKRHRGPEHQALTAACPGCAMASPSTQIKPSKNQGHRGRESLSQALPLLPGRGPGCPDAVPVPSGDLLYCRWSSLPQCSSHEISHPCELLDAHLGTCLFPNFGGSFIAMQGESIPTLLTVSPPSPSQPGMLKWAEFFFWGGGAGKIKK